ncbi:phosphoribosyltransferase family protein [Halomonas sp. M1]|uniref:phosphoribosyltransferase n=1 Tax=Halomonas sp. M1 TaxID=3035470 RepID=UPI0024865EAD|nr:phosphoribosyltransferase family protein [Halomonas sp. M1]WFE72044.1 phosphoribosyltransferase family protein [Halomonas sp. M1]
MHYKSYGDLSEDISASLFRVQGKGYDLVVGIPRSGMIPASMIALGLHIDVMGLPDFIANQTLKTRLGRKREGLPSATWDAKKVLLVDDSVLTGRTMQEALSAIPSDCPCRIDTLAIYTSSDAYQHVNISFYTLESPRVFQWNLFTPSMLSQACVDIDGVLCVDPTDHQNDDGEKYIAFLNNATPLFLPAGRIGCLVTNRLEKYRDQTEAWLKQQGITYERLVMLNLPSKEERQRQGIHSTHKGMFYKNSEYTFFIESDARQAASIANISGKAVYSCEDNRLYTGAENDNLLTNGHGLLRTMKKKIAAYIPRTIKAALKTKLRHKA